MLTGDVLSKNRYSEFSIAMFYSELPQNQKNRRPKRTSAGINFEFTKNPAGSENDIVCRSLYLNRSYYQMLSIFPSRNLFVLISR